jgi:hypothetical protein
MAKGYSSSWFFSGKWLESLATMDTYIEAEYNTSKNHGESQCDTLNISEGYLVILNLFLRGIHGDLLNLWTFGGEGIQQFSNSRRITGASQSLVSGETGPWVFSTFDRRHCQKSENDFLFPHISVPLWSLMVTLKELFGSDPFPHIAVAEDRSFPPTRVCKLGQMAGHVTGQ